MGYDNTNSGALFKNNRKETDTQPEYTGNVNADGTEYWLSAWVKTDKNGKKYFSLSLQPKERNYEDDIPEAPPIDDNDPPF